MRSARICAAHAGFFATAIAIAHGKKSPSLDASGMMRTRGFRTHDPDSQLRSNVEAPSSTFAYLPAS
jgi:hypothetical protein